MEGTYQYKLNTTSKPRSSLIFLNRSLIGIMETPSEMYGLRVREQTKTFRNLLIEQDVTATLGSQQGKFSVSHVRILCTILDIETRQCKEHEF